MQSAFVTITNRDFVDANAVWQVAHIVWNVAQAPGRESFASTHLVTGGAPLQNLQTSEIARIARSFDDFRTKSIPVTQAASHFFTKKSTNFCRRRLPEDGASRRRFIVLSSSYFVYAQIDEIHPRRKFKSLIEQLKEIIKVETTADGTD